MTAGITTLITASTASARIKSRQVKSSQVAFNSMGDFNTIRYDTIEEINVDSKAEYTA